MKEICKNCKHLEFDDDVMGFSGSGYICYNVMFNDVKIIPRIKNGHEKHPIKNAFLNLNGLIDNFKCENFKRIDK